jgi:hypothetical protein
MAHIKIRTQDLPEVVVRQVRKKLSSHGVASILADRAKRRIREGGDSEIKYPELWSKTTQIGLRKDGIPLRDTGNLMNLLSTTTERNIGGIKWTLLDGSGYGVKHQEGFRNQGPIAIAVSTKARLPIKSLGESPHDIAYLDSLNLEEAPNATAAQNPEAGSIKYDYYVLEGPTEVPARPIANMPPEDIKAVVKHIERTIRN